MKVTKVAYHRNGVCGIGFHVVLFESQEKGDRLRHFVATVFPEQGAVSVLDIHETEAGNIEFANGNSWRGDYFETKLRHAIHDWELLDRAGIDK